MVLPSGPILEYIPQISVERNNYDNNKLRSTRK